MSTRARNAAVMLVLVLAFGAPALAGDDATALVMTRIAPPPDLSGQYFGTTVSGGDFDGDGFADILIGAGGDAAVFYGAPSGVDGGYGQVLFQQFETQVDAGWYGDSVAAIDLDGDGSDEVLVAAGEYAGAVFVYETGPSGVLSRSESVLAPLDRGAQSPFFGSSLANVGDVDGDGMGEVLVGAHAWSETQGPNVRYTGAAFLYAPGDGGVDTCSELRIPVPGFQDGPARWIDFGSAVSSAGDMDDDGYGDIAVSCPLCGIPDCLECGSVIEWSGGAIPSFGPDTAHVLSIPDPPLWKVWNAFGQFIDSAGHVDGDVYGDLIVGSERGGVMFYGSPVGPDPDRLDRDGLLNIGQNVTGIGDLDADGFDDVLIAGNDGSGHVPVDETLRILFGSETGIDKVKVLETPSVAAGNGFGNAVDAIGDVNGDGRIDMLAGAVDEGSVGAAYVISPVCVWYLDADADGHGDPAVSLADCHDQPGYAPNPDDCDDTDATVYGARWYPDLDGDGYGTKVSGGALACTQPTGSSAFWTDCDDGNASRHPEATDDTVDGLDQDCDEHDGAWEQDSGDCPEPDTGDSGDTAVDSGDTAPPLDSADSAADSAATPAGDEPGEGKAGEPGCGCDAGRGAGGGVGGLVGVVALATRRFRRPRAPS